MRRAFFPLATLLQEINLATMSHKEKEDAKNEIRVLAQLSHPNIVKLYEYLMVRVPPALTISGVAVGWVIGL